MSFTEQSRLTMKLEAVTDLERFFCVHKTSQPLALFVVQVSLSETPNSGLVIAFWRVDLS